MCKEQVISVMVGDLAYHKMHLWINFSALHKLEDEVFWF